VAGTLWGLARRFQIKSGCAAFFDKGCMFQHSPIPHGPACHLMNSWLRSLVLLFGITLATMVHGALDQQTLLRVPTPQQVEKDFSDRAERTVALKVLYTFLQPHASSDMMSAVGRKAAGFYNASLDVEHAVTNAPDAAKAYPAYSARVQELSRDPRFKERVLAKYRLATTSPGAPATHLSPEQAELDQAIRDSIVWWIAAGVLILVLAPILLLFFDRRAFPRPKVQDPAWMTLPESLQEVALLGRRYFVQWHCGLVVDKETTIETRQHMSVMVDRTNQVQPVEIQTAREVIRKDALWVRLQDGREKAWNFTNASLQARPSHVVSGLGRTLRDGSAEFILGFNHTTEQLEVLSGLSSANRPRKFLAFIAITLCGAVAFHLAFGSIIRGRKPYTDPQWWLHTGTWGYPLVLAAVVCAIVVPVAAAVITGIRNARFRRRYLPRYLETLKRLELRRKFEHPGPVAEA